MPGMKLTIEQIQRLCGIEPRMCTVVLDALVRARFWCLKTDGTYVRMTDDSEFRSRPAKEALKSKLLVTVSRCAS